MELLVRAACADDEAQEPRKASQASVRKGGCPPLRGERRECELRAAAAAGAAHRVGAHPRIEQTVNNPHGQETKEALTPEYGDSYPQELPSRQTTSGLSSKMASGLYERRSLSTQINNPSPVFGPVTPDDQEDEREKCVMRSGDISRYEDISPLRTNATARPASTSVQLNGQVRTSTTPPLQEQHAAVQHYVASRRESLAAEQPGGTHCVACKTLFAATRADVVVIRPRPGYCEHVFCRGCYEAYAGRRLPDWPCPECERLAVFAPHPMMTGAVPFERLGVAQTLMPPWAMAGTPHFTMIPRGPMVPTAAATNRPSDILCGQVPRVRPLVSASVRPGAADPGPMSASTSSVTDDPKSRKSSTRPVVPGLESAICKRAGSKHGSRRTTWACTQPGCKYIAQSSRHMLRHMTTHTGERPFVCKWPGCSYRAKQREHLKTHELKHSNTKSYKCHVCGFATKRKEHLKRHIGRHSTNHVAETL